MTITKYQAGKKPRPASSRSAGGRTLRGSKSTSDMQRPSTPSGSLSLFKRLLGKSKEPEVLQFEKSEVPMSGRAKSARLLAVPGLERLMLACRRSRTPFAELAHATANLE